MKPISCKCLPGLVAVLLLLLLQTACTIPQIATRSPSAALPQTFSATTGTDTTGVAAGRRWDDFFDDPYLLQLVDTALVNNKELNILVQRISIARNEIQARRGEYLPFVSTGVATDVEKVGRYTRNGALEENIELNEERAFPEFLTNIQLGLYASWEIDVWNKLRNARKAAVMEYLATVEGRQLHDYPGSCRGRQLLLRAARPRYPPTEPAEHAGHSGGRSPGSQPAPAGGPFQLPGRAPASKPRSRATAARPTPSNRKSPPPRTA